MWALINAPQNWAFGAALLLMLLFGALELLGLLMGGLSQWLDALLPDSLVDADLDGDMSAEGAGLAASLLSWLYVGKIPMLILLVCALALFGGCGLFIQSLAKQVWGHYLPALAAIPLSVALTLPALRLSGAGLYAILPRDETSAISQAALLGRVGEIVLGEAKPGYPSQAKVKDAFGQTHYVMVEPDSNEHLPQGSQVLLMAQHGVGFKAILNPNLSMVDRETSIKP